MVRAILAVLLFAWSTTATASPPPAWTVETGSRLGFSGAMNGDGFSGTFSKWVARIRFDPANLAQSTIVVVVATGSARTGESQRDEALPSADWFSIRTFPTATFRSTAIRSLGGGRFVASGRLKIRSVERPVSLPFTLAITGDRAAMKGSVTIDRRTFGVGQDQFASPETVAANVRIDVSLAARKQK